MFSDRKEYLRQKTILDSFVHLIHVSIQPAYLEQYNNDLSFTYSDTQL